MSSCNSQNSRLKSPNFQAEFDSLKSTNETLVLKNDSLMNALNTIKKKYGLDKPVNNESDKLLLNFKLGLTKVKTGYIVSDYENLFLPAVTLEFKNLSQNDLEDDVTLDAYFINNNTGEQLSTDFNFFTDKHTVLMGGMSKQVTLNSKIGWSAIQKQDISVRLYINKQFFKLYKIENTEYFGRL
jgi:hypothetical protein